MLKSFLAIVLLAALPFTSNAAEKKGKGKSPDRWETTIAAFEAADKTSPPPKNAVLLVGGSNAKRWTNVSEYFPGHQVINRGFGGAQLGEVAHFADRIVLPYAPKIIFMNAGGNDLGGGKSPEQIRDSYKAFVKKVQAALPATRIYYISIPPVMRAAKAPESMAAIKRSNQLMEEFSRTDAKLGYIDLFPAFLDAAGQPKAELFVSDGTHFSPKGCEVVAKLMREAAGLNK